MLIDITDEYVYSPLPVSLEEFRYRAGIDIDSDNVELQEDLLTTILTSAIDHIERETGLCIKRKLYQNLMDSFPTSGHIILPVAPIQDLVKIEYIYGNVVYEWPIEEYIYDAHINHYFPRISPAYNYSFPQTDVVINAVTITFYAGLDPITNLAKECVLRLATTMWAKKMTVASGAIADLPFSFTAAINKLRVI